MPYVEAILSETIQSALRGDLRLDTVVLYGASGLAADQAARGLIAGAKFVVPLTAGSIAVGVSKIVEIYQAGGVSGYVTFPAGSKTATLPLRTALNPQIKWMII